MLKYRSESLKLEQKEETKSPSAEESKETPEEVAEKDEKDDEKITAKLVEWQEKLKKRDKARSRKKKELQLKQRKRLQMSGVGKGDKLIDADAEHQGSESLFGLGVLDDDESLQTLHQQGEEGEEDLNELVVDSDSEGETEERLKKLEGEESDGDAEIEANLDELYKQYRTRRKMKPKNKLPMGLEGDEDDENQLKEGDSEPVPAQEPEPEHPLLVDFKSNKPSDAAARWFEREAFTELDNVDEKEFGLSNQKENKQELSDSDVENGEQENSRKKKNNVGKTKERER